MSTHKIFDMMKMDGGLNVTLQLKVIPFLEKFQESCRRVYLRNDKGNQSEAKIEEVKLSSIETGRQKRHKDKNKAIELKNYTRIHLVGMCIMQSSIHDIFREHICDTSRKSENRYIHDTKYFFCHFSNQTPSACFIVICYTLRCLQSGKTLFHTSTGIMELDDSQRTSPSSVS
eukprot:506836_1